VEVTTSVGGAAGTPSDDDMDNPALADLTRAELIELIEQQRERGIRISFSGKANARGLARRVRPRTLKHLKTYGAGSEEERARNQLIEGDNLQSMVTLYRLRGQVDLILTDPPYNTGNDFRYNDRWDQDPNDDGIGEWVRPDDPARHTKWIRFMYPRLQMMKLMLRPGGVLAICIDHRELFRLGQTLDEIFGERNRLAVINWQKTTAPKSVRQRIRPQSADDRLTLLTPAHLDAKDPVEQPDTGGRTTNHADTHFYAAQGNSPKQPQQIGASRLRPSTPRSTALVQSCSPSTPSSSVLRRHALVRVRDPSSP